MSTTHSNQKPSSILKYALCFLIVVNLILNYLYRNQLYAFGEQMIANFQQSQNIFLTALFLIPTILIDPSLVIGVSFALIIAIKKKQKSFATVIWILLNAYLACLLKAYYADPRPFWTSDQVSSIGLYCPVQYGNPSGHSWFAVTVGLGFLVQKFGPGKSNKNIYISVLLLLLVPTSRMYLGAHSLNQVIQGVYLGLVMVMLYKFTGLKQTIEEYLKNFHAPGHKWKLLTIGLHILYLVPFVMNYDTQSPAQWTSNILEECHHTPTPNQLNFTMLMLNSIIVNFTTGIAYGYEQITNSPKGLIYLSGQWLINQQRYTLLCGYVLFVLIELGLMLIGLLPLAAGVYVFGMNELVLFIGGNIGVFLAGYLYTSRTWKLLFEKQVIRQELL